MAHAIEIERIDMRQQSVSTMQTVSTYTPLAGPSSDPVLHGVAMALTQMFPLVEHPISYEEEEQLYEAANSTTDAVTHSTR